MRDRWHRGSGGSKNPYDPQIGAAAQANTALAERSEQWNEDYFNKYVSPALEQMVTESKTNLDRQGKLYDIQYDQTKTAADRYKTLGIPAEDAYYKMVKDYSGPEEQQRQATAALGDVRTAAAGQAQQQSRQLTSLGIDPSSPAALAASSDMAVKNAATEAGAATRAREAAKVLGMSLTSDAANFGRGGASGVLQAASGAGGSASAGLSGATAAAATAPGGAGNVNTGFGTSAKAYGSNLDAYTGLGTQSIQSYQSPMQGLGQLAGQLGGAAISKWAGGSDRRIKKHMTKIATMAHGIGLWTFHYLWEPVTAPLRFGYMADEVEKAFPHAVTTGPGGYKIVDYSLVDV
jgi:hypothetical protein